MESGAKPHTKYERRETETRQYESKQQQKQ